MYPIVVSSRNDFTRKQKRRLKRYGLKWGGDSFYGLLDSDKKIQSIKYYCQAHKLKFKINNSLGNRSSDYRRIFFIYNKPQLFGKYYICAYCGKLLSKDRLTVDHLYPIGKASKSIKYQKKLSRRGVNNINDAKNLVGSCSRCNSRKGAKAGFWIIKGKLGKSKTLWYIRWLIRFSLVVAIFYYVFVIKQFDYHIILEYFRKLSLYLT